MMNVFVDTNILIYNANISEPNKIAFDLLSKKDINIFISTQNINEFIAASIRKRILTFDVAIGYAMDYFESLDIVIINREIILKAFDIKIQYAISYWDSMVVSSALSRKCDILYSEYMHHGLIVENTLKIVNPFMEKA